MTILVKKQKLSETITAEITVNKYNAYNLLVYHETGNDTIQNNDIITDKTYYNELAARRALYRIKKQLTQ